jgi:hypothetical protein
MTIAGWVCSRPTSRPHAVTYAASFSPANSALVCKTEARSRAIPHRSRRFGIGSSYGYAAFGWLGSTWQLRG